MRMLNTSLCKGITIAMFQEAISIFPHIKDCILETFQCLILYYTLIILVNGI